MPTKKQRVKNRTKMFSLTLYLQNQAAERADKLVLREEKRQAKLEAQKNKKKHVHTEECHHEH